jgi:hypothetical protein
MAEGYQGYQSLSHSKWDWKYHVVFIPKNRRKFLFGQADTTWVRFFMPWVGRFVAKSAISQGSIFGLEDMRYRPLDLN